MSLRWKIRQDPNGRGVYTCHHMMNGGLYDGEVYQAEGDSHWHDFRFLSRRLAREGVVYTATGLEWYHSFARATAQAEAEFRAEVGEEVATVVALGLEAYANK